MNTKRIPVKTSFSRDQLNEKSVFVDATLGKYHYKAKGTIFASKKDDFLYIELHILEQASHESFIVHVINLNQEIANLLRQSTDPDCDFQLIKN
jgi:hypothetical protein